MSRKKHNIQRNFFDCVLERNGSVCKICRRVFKGNYLTNLKRHLIEEHKSQYESELRGLERSEPVEKKKKVSVTFGSNEVKDACVQLVTTEKMPFALLDTEPFKKLTCQIFSGLNMGPITSRNIMEHVAEKYKTVKASIIKAMTHKLISLKLDIASRHSRGILGVNAQYYEDNSIKVVTLAIIELNKKHTGANLSAEIESTFIEDFSLTKSQIYSVTSDNGGNIIKSIEILNEDSDDSADDDEEELETQVNVCSMASVKCAAHTQLVQVMLFLRRLASWLKLCGHQPTGL
ncbi:uncharacterized protein DMAD_00182 [Drosophila madeirensis]|uniref:BED-type domain-containing protein n=1 Tax=Drosophila madeirensis TaxID=30013 RepID=A0AAU9FWE3_DROMD